MENHCIDWSSRRPNIQWCTSTHLNGKINSTTSIFTEMFWPLSRATISAQLTRCFVASSAGKLKINQDENGMLLGICNFAILHLCVCVHLGVSMSAPVCVWVCLFEISFFESTSHHFYESDDEMCNIEMKIIAVFHTGYKMLKFYIFPYFIHNASVLTVFERQASIAYTSIGLYSRSVLLRSFFSNNKNNQKWVVNAFACVHPICKQL